MTRNTEREISVRAVKSPYSDNLVRWHGILKLEPHSAEDHYFTFEKVFDTEEQARDWANRLDMMLAYGSVEVSRYFPL